MTSHHERTGFYRVRPGTFWPSVWTHSRGTWAMKGQKPGWGWAAMAWVASALGSAGHAAMLTRSMLVGTAWQADGGRIVMTFGRRDTARRWAVDVLLLAVAVHLSWRTYTAPATQPGMLVALGAAWVGLIVGGPWYRRRLPSATWTVGGLSSRAAGARALLRAASHVQAVAAPGDTVVTRAASDKHLAVYQRFGFRSVAGDPHTLIAVIPARASAPVSSGQLRSQP